MRYCDTSFLTPLIREEKFSTHVARLVADFPPGELAISRWTMVEVASLLARDVRMGVMTAVEAREADMLLGDIVRRSLVVVSPDSGDYDLAIRYLHAYQSGLRAGDALHLAVAGNYRADIIYTFDKGMLKAGRLLGLPTSDGGGSV